MFYSHFILDFTTIAFNFSIERRHNCSREPIVCGRERFW